MDCNMHDGPSRVSSNKGLMTKQEIVLEWDGSINIYSRNMLLMVEEFVKRMWLLMFLSFFLSWSFFSNIVASKDKC